MRKLSDIYPVDFLTKVLVGDQAGGQGGGDVTVRIGIHNPRDLKG